MGENKFEVFPPEALKNMPNYGLQGELMERYKFHEIFDKKCDECTCSALTVDLVEAGTHARAHEAHFPTEASTCSKAF